MTLSSLVRKTSIPSTYWGVQIFPHVHQQGQSNQSPPWPGSTLSPPCSAILVQRDRNASRLDQEQKLPSAQGSANNALSHGATEGDGTEGFLEQLLQRRVWKRHQHTTMLYTWAIASKIMQETRHAFSSRHKEVSNAHHWQLESCSLPNIVEVTPGCQDMVHYRHLVQIKAITEA